MKLLNSYMPGSKRLQDDLSKRSSDKTPRLFLLRHGQLRGQGQRRFIGSTDIPLDRTGRAQARAWAPLLNNMPFTRVYTSGLVRSRETATLACPGLKACVDPRLNEIDLGAWDGLSFDRIKTEFPNLFEQRGRDIYGFRPPGGESFKDLFTRTRPFFDGLSLTSPTLVVAHAGVIRLMLSHWAGRPLDELLTVKTAYGQLFMLAME